ncbi:hypothetical protein PG988_007253 [Apiospora saccharicola]
MPDIVLNRAIDKFRKSLTDEQKKLFVASSLERVKDEIQFIQGRYGSTKKLRSLGRLSKFLEVMAQIEQLVLIFLNVSEVVAFVWGPIKLALMMAGTRVQTLEQLLDTYVEIGEVIPSLQQYESLFKDAPAVLEVLERYFCDILEFHRNAMDVFARPVSTIEAQSEATLKNWAAELLKTQTSCIIILDGLDECNHHGNGHEATKIMEWFLNSILPNCLNGQSEMRLLGLGQRDGVVDHVLSGYPSFSLDNSMLHIEDIRSFAKTRASDIGQRFPLDPGEEESIAQKVTSAAGAMFLYVKVVMDNLMAQCSADELDDELNVNFPKGLDEAQVTPEPYLIQRSWVNLPEANASMAIFSSIYLASLPFRVDSAATILEHALNGYYGFLDYAVFSWQEHLKLSLERSQELFSSTLQDLHQEVIRIFRHLDSRETPEGFGDNLGDITGLFDAKRLKRCIQRLEHLSTAIRKVLENMDLSPLDSRNKDVFLSLNGKPQFKCPKPRCLQFSHGFGSKKARDSHIACHYAEFICSTDGCSRGKVGFFTLADLKHHIKKAHSNQVSGQLRLFPTSSRKGNIYAACSEGDIQAIMKFQEKGVKFNNTHLFEAAKNGRAELSRYLASNVCDIFIEKFDHVNGGALRLGICERNVNACRLLESIATPGEINECLKRNFDLYLGLAVNCGKREILGMLLKLNSRRRRPLGYWRIFQVALNHVCSIEPEYGDENLYEYIFSFIPRSDVPKILSEHTMEKALDSDTGQALVLLLHYMDDNITQVKSTTGDSPLYKALSRNRRRCVKALLEHGFVNDMRPKTNLFYQDRPLHYTCRKDMIQLFKMILPYSMDHLNDANGAGDTPLHIAVVQGALRVTKALLKTGEVDFCKRDGIGRTVFEIPVEPKMAALLQSAGGNTKLPMGRELSTVSNAPDDPESEEMSDSVDDDHTEPDRWSDEGFAIGLETSTASLPLDNDGARANKSPALHQSRYAVGNGDQLGRDTATDADFTGEYTGGAPFLDLDWDEWLNAD